MSVWYLMRASGVVSLLLLTAVFVLGIATTSVVGVAAVFVPFLAGRSAFWVGLGAVSLDLVAALIVTSLLRARLRLRLWRAVHWIAYLAWPLALGHSLGVGSDTGTLWLQALAVGCIASVVSALAWRVRRATDGAKHLEPQPA